MSSLLGQLFHTATAQKIHPSFVIGEPPAAGQEFFLHLPMLIIKITIAFDTFGDVGPWQLKKLGTSFFCDLPLMYGQSE